MFTATIICSLGVLGILSQLIPREYPATGVRERKPGSVTLRSVSRFESLGDVLDRTKGIGQGFDTMRIVLSVSILCEHSVIISYGKAVEAPLWLNPFSGGPIAALLPVFFALSGFLVMGSAVRTASLRVFLAARGLRILPALATEVTVSAVVLGSLVTTLPVRDYFTNYGFFRYFGSLLGNIQTWLPGVFLGNPYPDVVNISLWTIAPEVLCYAYIAFVMGAGLLGHRRGLSLLIAAATVLLIVGDLSGLNVREPETPFRPHTLILAFAVGNLLFLWRHAIPFSRALFAACLLAGLALVPHPKLSTLAIPFLVYATVYLGLLRLPKIPLLDSGDYSYGIYLYAMPVQQSVAFFFPQLRDWYWNILLALPITVALAMLSWTFIEKPALRLRKRLTGSAERRPNKHVTLASPNVLAVIVAYSLWLSSIQYNIPLLSAHRHWLFAALAVSVIAAVSSNIGRRVRAAAP